MLLISDQRSIIGTLQYMELFMAWRAALHLLSLKAGLNTGALLSECMY